MFQQSNLDIMLSIRLTQLSRIIYCYGFFSLVASFSKVAEAAVTVPSVVLSSPVGITVTKPEIYDTIPATFGIPFEPKTPHPTEILLPVVEKGQIVSSRNYMCPDDEFWIDFLSNTTTSTVTNDTTATKAKGSLRQRQFLQNSPLRNGKSKALLIPKGRCPMNEKIKMVLKINDFIKQNSDLEQENEDSADISDNEKEGFRSTWNKSKNKRGSEDDPAIKYVIIYDNTTSFKSTLLQEIEETGKKLAIDFSPSNSNASSMSNSTTDDDLNSDGINLYISFMNYYDGYMLNQLIYHYHWDQVKRNFGKENFDLPIGSIGIPAMIDSNRLYDTSSDSPRRPQWGLGTIAASWLRFVVCILLLLFPLVRTLVLWYSAGGRIRIRSEENGSGRIGIYYVRPHPNWLSGFRNGDMNTGTGMFGNDSTAQDSLLTKEEVLALPEVSYDPEQINITCCSICLDEYEDGEMVRMLPCGHVFHTDCILPWLTERQACCPLCKVNVRTAEEENNDSETTEPSSPEDMPHSSNS